MQITKAYVVVWEFSGDGQDLRGVFSTEAKARKWISGQVDAADLKIYEHEIDSLEVGEASGIHKR